MDVPSSCCTTPSLLSIAVLGWARLSAQASEGSGYNLSASELAAGLAMTGHRVGYLRSGMNYSIIKRPHVRMCEWWRGVACFDFFNSKNVSPASSNFLNMPQEMSSPEDSRVVLTWLDSIGAQVVHIHSLEGYGLDLIGAIRDSGRPVIVTPHNYWYACPQVDLLHEELRVCDDYRGGTRCVGCLKDAPPPAKARNRRGVEQEIYRKLGPVFSGWARQVYDYLKHRANIRKSINAGRSIVGGHVVLDPPPLDPESALGFDVGAGDLPTITSRPHAQVRKATEYPKPPDIGVAPLDQNERFLHADHHLTVVNEYGRRRVAGIAALNRASLVTPPSRFMLESMRAMGMSPEIGRHVRLGQPHFDQIHRRVKRSPYYSARPWDPASSTRSVRFGFMGTTRNNKGLEVLTRAIPLLDTSVRNRCHFAIRAAGWDAPFRARLRDFPEVLFLGGYDPRQLASAMDEIDVGILPHIWFENSPLVLLEFLHAGKFVIASRLGGPPEWIHEPSPSSTGNGLLFPAGDAAALAACITRVVRGQATIPSAQEVHAISELRDYPEHVAEFSDIYQALLDGTSLPRERAATPTQASDLMHASA